MKKIKNALFLFFIALFVLSGCKITAIEADEDTTSVIYDINDFELEDIKLLVTKKGSQKTSISLSEEMISTADLLLLDVVGSHDITVRYHGLETLINIKLKFADVNYQLLDIYQKLVMYNSYSGSYENWVGGLTNNGLQITEAIINSEERVKITFSDGSQIDAGKISAPTSTDTVNILSINDTHGAFYT
ncbi:MAG: hypothetical protein PHX62_08045, partial [Bacilli bacterium]|nr:hypothetical protein [Bacilli bacterium]